MCVGVVVVLVVVVLLLPLLLVLVLVVEEVVAAGAVEEKAWSLIEMMQRGGVSVDNFTISIMMKSLKKLRGPKDVAKILDLLDRSGVDVCTDEILLNTILETCIRHREFRRLTVCT